MSFTTTPTPIILLENSLCAMMFVLRIVANANMIIVSFFITICIGL